MKNKKKKSEAKKHSPLIYILRAELIAVGLTLILVALLSFLLYKGVLGIEAVPALNTVIKLIGALSAAVITCVSICQKRLVYSTVSGGVYVILSFLLFSLMCGKFEISVKLLSDIGIGVGAGVLTGLACGIIKK